MAKITIERVNKKINSWTIEKVNSWFRKLDLGKQIDFLEQIFPDITIYNIVEEWEIFFLESFKKKNKIKGARNWKKKS